VHINKFLASASAAVFSAIATASAVQVDLTNNSDYTLKTLVADFGGSALVGNFKTQPAGTGVFDPFLTVHTNGSGTVESGFNTSGHSALYLNQQRPEWNNYLRLQDLATITINGKSYYAFELDANEPGNGKSLLSIDNIRIYTSATDNTGLVRNNENKIDLLGTKRFALNDVLKTGNTYNANNWIKLDANQSQSNGGSGVSDMILYVPVTAFAGALPTDYVWFYNLNGVHYTADGTLAAQAGYEEWRAVRRIASVPEAGSTVVLLAGALTLLALAKRRLQQTNA
jgi:hypothetical protein